MAEIREHPASLEWLSRRVAELERSPVDGGGGGSDNGGMEARVARLEASAQHIERDISEIKGDQRSMLRWGLSVFAGGFVLTWAGLIALALLMAKGFGWL